MFDTSIFDISFLPAAVSFSLAFFVTPFVIKMAWKLGIVDDPKKHKHPKVIHKYPVPRGGGVAIFFAFITSSILFLPLDKHLTAIFIGAFIVIALGLLDDKYDLNPYLRFGVQFIAAGIPIIAGIGISFISNPIGPGIIDLSYPRFAFELFGETRTIWLLSDFFALFWIVFMMNMVNMGAKGIDGQLPGVVAIAAVAVAVLSAKFSADITQWPVIILASITAGAYLGFLPWNFYPQKIMPSFSGSTLGGYVLAILSILATTKVGTLTIVLAIPLFDVLFSVSRRIISGKSPFWGDRGHLHHKLLDIGLSKRQVVYIYWIFTALLAFLSLNLNPHDKLYTIIGIGVIIGGSLTWLTYRFR